VLTENLPVSGVYCNTGFSDVVKKQGPDSLSRDARGLLGEARFQPLLAEANIYYRR